MSGANTIVASGSSSTQQVLRVATSKLVRETQDENKDEIDVGSAQLKTIRNAVRGDETLIPEYVDYLNQTIKRSMSDTRMVLLSLIDYFFCRSHAFRSKVVGDIQELLKLVCEIDPLHCPLPGPTQKAKQLKVYAIKRLKAWHEKFGPGYIKLQGVPEYLKYSKSMDFQRASAELLAEQRRKEDEERKKIDKARIVMSSVKQKYEALKINVDRHLTELDTGLRILVPQFEQNDQSLSSYGEEMSTLDADERKKLHGYSSSTQSISIVVESTRPSVSVNEENEDLVQSVKDARIMLDAYRKDIQTFIHKITACAYSETNELLKELIEKKRKVDMQLEKADELRIEWRKKKEGKLSDSGSDESDMEDVPDKPIEDFMMPDEVPKHILERVKEMEREEKIEKKVEEDKPGCSRDFDSEPGPSTSKPATSKIPILPFGLDLKYWGEERRVPVQIPKNNSDSHRFWRAPDEDTIVTEDRPEVYETRVFTFVGEEKRSEKKCKARLKDGRLCPRMDFVRCPIHGVIVDRDEEGFPVEEINESEEIEQREREERAHEREQREYLNDLEAATGVDLSDKSRKREKKKKKSRYAPSEGQAVRQRLEKKLFDKRSLKRIAETLDAIQKAKIQKKFGDQFAHL